MEEPSDQARELETETISKDSCPEPTPKKRKREDKEESDEGLICPVCFDVWTSAGSHRIISLKCGHLFGLSCVERWLKSAKTCPTCNGKTTRKDIREIYAATRIKVVDTSDLEAARSEIRLLQSEKIKQAEEIAKLRGMVSHYKNLLEKATRSQNSVSAESEKPFMRKCVTKKLLLSSRMEDSCRVLACDRSLQRVFVSQSRVGPLWPGFGVRSINGNGVIGPFQRMHKKELRDLAFHPTNDDLLLSVGLDHEVKLFDVALNFRVLFSRTFQEPIWCACWDLANTNCVFVGSNRGRVYRLAVMGTPSECELPCPVDIIQPVPVLSLKPALRLSCLLCCRLKSVTAYTTDESLKYNIHVLLAEESLSGMVFSEDEAFDPTMVVCCRPSTTHPSERFICYRVEASEGAIKCVELFVILGGNMMFQLTRPSLVATRIGLLFITYVEGVSSVFGWILGQDSKAVCIQTNNFVKDILAVRASTQSEGDVIRLFLLEENNFKLYELLV